MKLAHFAADAMNAAACEMFAGARLYIYTHESVLLAELDLPAFRDGEATIQTVAIGTGKASWFCCMKGGDTIADGDIGTDGADLILDRLDIEAGGLVKVTFTVGSENS